jgi:hypothetical protein
MESDRIIMGISLLTAVNELIIDAERHRTVRRVLVNKETGKIESLDVPLLPKEIYDLRDELKKQE